MIKETKVKKSRTDLTKQLFDMKMDTKIGFWERIKAREEKLG
jgi:hypothetical protein